MYNVKHTRTKVNLVQFLPWAYTMHAYNNICASPLHIPKNNNDRLGSFQGTFSVTFKILLRWNIS